MNGRDFAYLCGGAVLGVLGTVTFLWFWEERQEDISVEDAPEQPVQTTAPVTVDKSTLDENFVPSQNVDYSAMADYLYGSSSDETPEKEDGQEPRRITDEEFDILSSAGNYDTKDYTLYTDGVLADSVRDDVISESDAFVALGPNYTARKLQRIFARGVDSGLETIYIRNDRLYTLYEITTDERTYREVVEGDVR